MEYFISDMHLGHANIIGLCDRPFSSVEEMDEELISRWNGRVGPSDTVYIVGDLFWSKRVAEAYLPRLAGHKILIRGNHDVNFLGDAAAVAQLDGVYPYLELKLDGKRLTLCHYPMLEWRGSRELGEKGEGYLIYGHIHNRLAPAYRYLWREPHALNAGADVVGFRPVTLAELIELDRARSLSLLDGEDREYFLAALAQLR